MRSTTPAIALVLMFLLMAGLSPAAAETFDVAADQSGTVWMLSAEHHAVFLKRLDGDTWSNRARFERNAAFNLKIRTDGDGLLFGWVEAESGELQLYTLENKKVRAIDFKTEGDTLARADSFDIQVLGNGRFGLFTIQGASGAWSELLADGTVQRSVSMGFDAPAQSPSVLVKDRIYLAWQERAASTTVCAGIVGSGGMEIIARRDVDGFGGVVAPQLLYTDQPVLVWQEKRNGRAALSSLAVSTMGAAEPLPLTLPEGINGALGPRKAVGSDSLLSAYAWKNGQWNALRFDMAVASAAGEWLGTASETGNGMREPRLVVADGRELCIWKNDVDAAIGTVAATSLKQPVAKEVRVPVQEEEGLTFLAFGDSITEGKLYIGDNQYEDQTPSYTERLTTLFTTYVESLVIVQEGVGGESTLEGLERMAQILADSLVTFDYVLLLEGTNDYWEQEIGADPQLTINNLAEMVDMIREHGAIPVLGTMLPRGRYSTPADQRALKVTGLMIPMARLKGVTLAHFHSDFPKTDDNLSDSDADKMLHPTQQGYELMGDIWFSALLTFQGDVNRDKGVDDADMFLCTTALKAIRGSYLFNPDIDFNDDGIIDVRDLTFLLGQRGKSFQSADSN